MMEIFFGEFLLVSPTRVGATARDDDDEKRTMLFDFDQTVETYRGIIEL